MHALVRALALSAMSLPALAACDRDPSSYDANIPSVMPSGTGGGGVGTPFLQPSSAGFEEPTDVLVDTSDALADVPLGDASDVRTDGPTPGGGDDLLIGPFPGDGVGAFPGDGVGAFPGDGVGAFPGDGVGAFPGDAVGAFPGDAVGPLPGGDEPAPAQGAAFFEWLLDGSYLGFPFATGLEFSEVHGPMRVYMNEALTTSRVAGGLPGAADQHPEGAAVVAELFAPSTLTFQGWLAIVKTQPDSQSGLGWFWFESSAVGPPSLAQPGAGTCVGCHLLGDDFILDDFPSAP